MQRSYLPAAPGRGAVRAVFDMTLQAEAARAKGRVSATTSYDLRQYYEHVDLAELAVGARRFGLPLPIVALLSHLYVGPRRIRVGTAVSRTTYPRRSILAGCTFALLVIRLITIVPVEKLLAVIADRAKGWDIKVEPMFYVDDGVVSSFGSAEAVALLHGWITRLVFNWIRVILRKQTAAHNSSCVVSCPTIRGRITEELRDLDIPVTLGGEMLGIDFAAGRRLRKRPTQVKRRRKACRRRKRIAWWRGLGGRAARVARAGAFAGEAYGAEVVGLPPAALRDARSIHAAATPIKCGGASLTAKLALGGEKFAELDPAILSHNPPLGLLLQRLWDAPCIRADAARAWYQARAEVGDAGEHVRWNAVRGPVSAAYAHLLRIGAAWPKAFELVALGRSINILSTPPRQVMAILQVQARRFYDHALLRRLSQAHGWDADQVLEEYKFGINWQLLRDILNGRKGELDAKQKRLLHIVSTGGFWPEERRWQCGLLPSATCTGCGDPKARPFHRLHDCGADEAWRILEIAAGNASRLLAEARRPRPQPLVDMGLPPQALDWNFIEADDEEGEFSMGCDGYVYGDGSGYHQDDVGARIATWSITRVRDDGFGNTEVISMRRGTVGGWWPTVPRGELRALIEFLRHCSGDSSFVGDCRYVVEGAARGVSQKLRSSVSLDADLWKAVHELLRDHGSVPRILKTRAHRSRANALQDEEDGLQHWAGNAAADVAAKTLAKATASSAAGPSIRAAKDDLATKIICAVARGAARAVMSWPELAPRGDARRTVQGAAISTFADDDGDAYHSMRRGCGGRFECAVCRKLAHTPAGARRMSRAVCGGAISPNIHSSHRLFASHGTLWCGNCGAYSTRWPRRLVQSCAGRPCSQAQRNVLRRLLAGLTATTADYFDAVATAQGMPTITVDEVRVARPLGEVPSHLPHHPHQHRGNDENAHRASAEGHDQDAAAQCPPREVAPGERHVGEEGFPRGQKAVAPPYGYPRLEAARARSQGSLSMASSSPRPSSPPPCPPSSRPRQKPSSGSCSSQAEGGHWSRRLVRSQQGQGNCNVCSGSTRLSCQSCGRGLCLGCAKGGKPCQTEPSDSSGAEAGTASQQQLCKPRSLSAPPSPAVSVLGFDRGRHHHSDR